MAKHSRNNRRNVRDGDLYSVYLEVISVQESSFRNDIPHEGGVEYLHSDPASRRRRRQGKSRI
jgi:hypothetical protein